MKWSWRVFYLVLVANSTHLKLLYSKPNLRTLDSSWNKPSFGIVPRLGRWVTHDLESLSGQIWFFLFCLFKKIWNWWISFIGVSVFDGDFDDNYFTNSKQNPSSSKHTKEAKPMAISLIRTAMTHSTTKAYSLM